MHSSIPPAVRRTQSDGHVALFVDQYRLLEPLGQGGMGVVYRAEHIETGELVALKTARSTRRSAVASIRREAQILEHLHHPGVVTLLDHGVAQGVPWFAMECLSGPTLRSLLEAQGAAYDSQRDLGPPSTSTRLELVEVGASMAADGPAPTSSAGAVSTPTEPFDLQACRPLLQILGRLCETLSYLHGEGVVHRDSKPSNVFLRVKRRPVLVDFGVVTWFEGAHSRDRLSGVDRRRFAGTLQYMAPEQLRGELVDARADLYAVGCLLYRAVTGCQPFDAATPVALAQQHFLGSYRPPQQCRRGIPPQLTGLIGRLLQPDPERRVGHADVVAGVLAEVCGQAPGDTVTAQRLPVHLHKPRFVGRERLLAQVSARLGLDAERAERTPSANAALIGGVTGSGKTRLAMEIAARAEPHGYVVALGSCDVGLSSGPRHDPSEPLWAFRSAMQAVADHCRERGAAETRRVVGRRANVLAQYEPALSNLPGQPACRAPVPLPARAARARALAYLTETLVAFSEVRPLLIIVDDLHLADELSEEFVRKVLRTGSLPNVRLVATYDLTRGGDVADLLASPRVCRFELEPLSRQAVSSLVADILAMDEPPAELVAHLVEHAAFNPYVISEYVHDAVDEGLITRSGAGDWQIAEDFAARAADSVLRGTSRRLAAIIERRLERLDDAEKRLLEAIAVISHVDDLDVLGAICAMEPAQVHALAGRLCTMHLLEQGADAPVMPAQVREVAYRRIPAQRRQMLHRTVARALERRSGGEVEPGVMVEHWRRAGVRSRELCYIDKAAEQALVRGATASARLLLQRGLRLVNQLDATRRDDPSLGRRRARLERLLATVYWASGDLGGTVCALRRALDHLDFSLPSTPAQWGAAAVRETARQLADLVWQPDARLACPAERQRLRDVLECGTALFEPLVACGQQHRAVLVATMMANLADRLGAGDRCALPYAVLSTLAQTVGLELLADLYRTRARMNLSEETAAADFFGTVRLFVYTASASGDWPEVEALLHHARAYSKRVGDPLDYQALLVHEAYIHLVRDQRDRFDDLLAEIEGGSRRAGTRSGQIWARVLGAMAAHQDDAPGEALALLDGVLEPAEGFFPPTARLYALATAAVCQARLGRLGPALQRAEAAIESLEALTGRHDSMVSLYHVYGCVAPALLACSEALDLSAQQRGRAMQRARYMVRRTQRLAEQVPLAGAMAHRQQAMLDALAGDLQSASDRLSASLAEARRFELAHEDRLTRRAARCLGSAGRIARDAV